MVIKQRRSVFETRLDVLDAVRVLGEEAISARIALQASVSQRTLQTHLAFLQLKDLVTVADHTVEDRNALPKRGMSSVFRVTPQGKRLLSIIVPIREDLMSDKQRDWMESLKNGERRGDAILTA
ncbi:MAG: hypothetical protein ACYC7D_13285 [Nitrososphaerales archaeon]